ncbi:MAG: hypothetical protein JWO41_239 [Candidatus Saccharibacteria bacterium]|nr:hypothetical protein [Candidatus Saccharibacteria bacterium]
MPQIVDKFFKNRSGKIVIMQIPNPPLWLWIICEILSRVFKHGKTHSGLVALGTASLLAWAYMELTSGGSLFRRILGGLVLAATIAGFFR